MADDDDGFGPVERGSGRRGSAKAAGQIDPRPPRAERAERPPRGPRRRPRIGRWILVALLIYVLAGLAVLPYASSRINREDVAGLQRGVPTHVLIVGDDSREGLTDDELFELGTERVSGERSDTLLIMSVDGDRAGLLSLPRDLFVTRCDGSQGRINAAEQIGGLDCLVATVSSLTGLPIAHVVRMDFAAFVSIVDAVGGVPITLDAPMVDVPAGVDLPAGCTRLTGIQALGFVRARNQPDGDLGRIQRQQQFLSALAGEVATVSTIANVPRLYAAGGSAGAAMTADRGFGPGEMVRMARAMRALTAGDGVSAHTVPTTPQNVGGASVLVPTAEADGLFAAFRDGSILTGPPAEPAPEEARLPVLATIRAPAFAQAEGEEPAPEGEAPTAEPGC